MFALVLLREPAVAPAVSWWAATGALAEIAPARRGAAGLLNEPAGDLIPHIGRQTIAQLIGVIVIVVVILFLVGVIKI